MVVLPDLLPDLARLQLLDVPLGPDETAVQKARLLGRGPDGKVPSQARYRAPFLLV